MRASNTGTPIKVNILPLLASLSWKQLEIDWQFANRNCYRLSCVSWALPQISCFTLTRNLVQSSKWAHLLVRLELKFKGLKFLPTVTWPELKCTLTRRMHILSNQAGSMSAYIISLLVDQSSPIFAEHCTDRSRSSLFPIFDILIGSWDNQKLSEITPNFGVFALPIFWMWAVNICT